MPLQLVVSLDTVPLVHRDRVEETTDRQGVRTAGIIRPHLATRLRFVGSGGQPFQAPPTHHLHRNHLGRPVPRRPVDHLVTSVGPTSPRHRGTTTRGTDLTQDSLPRQTRYWCEASAYTTENGSFYPLGTHTATTPRLALRWLHIRTEHIAQQLDPPASHALRQWLCHCPEQERVLSLLRVGHPYTYAFQADGTHYSLSARPVPDLPMP